MYVLKREDGKYVAKWRSPKSYTSLLQMAQVFPTKEAAEASKCGNEHVVSVNNEMGS